MVPQLVIVYPNLVLVQHQQVALAACNFPWTFRKPVDNIISIRVIKRNRIVYNVSQTVGSPPFHTVEYIITTSDAQAKSLTFLRNNVSNKNYTAYMITLITSSSTLCFVRRKTTSNKKNCTIFKMFLGKFSL